MLAGLDKGANAQGDFHCRPQGGYPYSLHDGTARRCGAGGREGHEDYQEVKGVKHHFDDHEVIKEVFGI